MKRGTSTGGFIFTDRLAPTLHRARLGTRTVLVRTGSWEQARRLEPLGPALNGIPWECSDHPSGAALFTDDPGGVGLSDLAERFDEDTVRTTFYTLAQRIASLHAAGHTLGALDPAGVRVGSVMLIFPPMDPPHQHRAPETTPGGDWYLFGRLLYHVLAGAPLEPDPPNGPDPREHRPSAPDDLASLAMDLLLLDPDERCGTEEIFASLAPRGSAPPAPPGLDQALQRGGVWFGGGATAALIHRFPDSVISLDDTAALEELVTRAEVLTPAQRGLVHTLLTRPTLLDRCGLDRAGRLLGLALATAAVQAVWTRESEHPAMLGLLRVEHAPLLIVENSPSEALLHRLRAERVHGVEPADPEILSFDDDFDPSVRAIPALRELGVPTSAGWFGRLGAQIDRWSTGPVRSVTGDVTLHREAFELAFSLLWTDFPRAARAGAWLARHAAHNGDRDGFQAARCIVEWFHDLHDTDGALSHRGAGWRLLARAIRHRRSGQLFRTEQTLTHQLPIPGIGFGANALARLLLAEALIVRGEGRRARQLLDRLRVDARCVGLPAADRAARSLLALLGDPVELSLASPGGLLGWWGGRARIHRHLHEGALDRALDVARTLSTSFGRWPFDRSNLLATACIHLLHRLEQAVGCSVPSAVPEGHPLSPAWRALAEAVVARHRGDIDGLTAALAEAEHRFLGAHHDLLAAATARIRGLHMGGVRGGTLIEGADRALLVSGIRSIPRQVRALIPELGFPVHDEG